MPLKLYGVIGCAAVNGGSIDQLDPFLQARRVKKMIGKKNKM
jgi:hypothetical protein